MDWCLWIRSTIWLYLKGYHSILVQIFRSVKCLLNCCVNMLPFCFLSMLIKIVLRFNTSILCHNSNRYYIIAIHMRTRGTQEQTEIVLNTPGLKKNYVPDYPQIQSSDFYIFSFLHWKCHQNVTMSFLVTLSTLPLRFLFPPHLPKWKKKLDPHGDLEYHHNLISCWGISSKPVNTSWM